VAPRTVSTYTRTSLGADMPRFTKDGHTVETAVPTEAAELRRDGYKEEKARTADVKEADAAKADAPTPTK